VRPLPFTLQPAVRDLKEQLSGFIKTQTATALASKIRT